MAPPTPEELELFAPPTEEELKSASAAVSSPVDMSPPTPDEISSTKPMSQSYANLRKEMDKSLVDFVTESPGLLSTETTDEELAEIAKHHGVNVGDLKKYATFLGATQSDSPIEQEVAGSLGRVALNIPQKLLKVWQSDPNMERAMDDVQSLGSARRSLLRGTAESVVPISTTAQAAGGAAKVATAGGSKLMTALRTAGQAARPAAAIGGAAGVGYSEKGQEVPGAVIGAMAGGTLGAAVPAVAPGVRYLFGKNKLARAEQEAVEAVSKKLDLDSGTRQVAERVQQSEELIEDFILYGKKPSDLTVDDINLIIKEQVPKRTLNKTLNRDAVKQIDVDGVMQTVFDDELADELIGDMASNILDTRIRKVAHELTGKKPKKIEEAIALIQDYRDRQGATGFLNKYRNMVTLENATKYLKESGDRITSQPSFFGKALNFVSDAQFVLNRLDAKYGTNFAGILSDANSAYNRSTYALTKFRTDIDDTFKLAKKLGTDQDLIDGNKIYDAIDTGTLQTLSEKELETANKVKKFFEDGRQYVNSVQHEDIAPLSIPVGNRGNYIPKMMKQTDEAAVLINEKLDAVLQDMPYLGDLKRSELLALAKQDADVLDLLKTARITKSTIKNGKDLINSLTALTSTRKGNMKLETKARAALAREGEIPDYLLEKNVYKLMDMWTANTIRHLYLRNAIDSLGTQAKILAKAGADVESAYVSNLVKDIMGVRKGTAAEAYLQMKVQSTRKLQNIIDKYGKDSWQGGLALAGKAIPDMLNAMTRQIYPNNLGYFSPRAIIQNATALFTKVAPEIGNVYGYGQALRGATYATLNFKRLAEKTKMLGTVPDEFIRKGEQAIAEGIQRSSLYQIPAKALEGMAKAGMSLYQKSEQFNRVTVLALGEMLAKDLAAGRATAKKSISKFPLAVKKAISSAETQEEVANIIGRHLNDVTQYNYNRLSMAEFGRTLGPFFSTFSKWPTATAGEIIYELETKGKLQGTSRLLEKFIAPLLLLQTVDFIIGQERPEDDSLIGIAKSTMGMGKLEEGSSSDRYKRLVGSRGLSQAAPLGSIGGILTGEIFSPPVVDAITSGIFNPLIEGDENGVYRGLASAANNFIPGAGAVARITDDLVTIVTGERPEGSNFFDRTVEGARVIDKELSK